MSFIQKLGIFGWSKIKSMPSLSFSDTTPPSPLSRVASLSATKASIDEEAVYMVTVGDKFAASNVEVDVTTASVEVATVDIFASIYF